jgi:hypothetical protein
MAFKLQGLRWRVNGGQRKNRSTLSFFAPFESRGLLIVKRLLRPPGFPSCSWASIGWPFRHFSGRPPVSRFSDMARRSVFPVSSALHRILSGRPHSPCCPLVTASPPPAGLPPSRPALLGSALRSVWFHFQWQLAAPSFLDLMLGSSRLGSSGTLCGAVRSTLAAVPWLALPLNIAPTLGACGSGCRAACWACVAVLGPPRTPRRGG